MLATRTRHTSASVINQRSPEYGGSINSLPTQQTCAVLLRENEFLGVQIKQTHQEPMIPDLYIKIF